LIVALFVRIARLKIAAQSEQSAKYPEIYGFYLAISPIEVALCAAKDPPIGKFLTAIILGYLEIVSASIILGASAVEIWP
jgi:hypothetical protein